jgi:hypothetical protein
MRKHEHVQENGLYGTRERGRPSLMWAGSIERDIQILVIGAWKTTGTTGVAELR